MKVAIANQSEHDDVDEDSANDTPMEWKDAVAFLVHPMKVNRR